MKARPVVGVGPAAPLAEGAARIVKLRLGELRGLSEAAGKPHAETAQHDMRIAAKRLRYVLEMTGFCLGDAADPARERCRELQDVLGAMHDADVMLPRLREHRRLMRDRDAEAVRRSAGDADDLDPALAGRAPHRTAYRGLEVLEVFLLARRALLFERFERLWSGKKGRAIFDALDAEADRLLGGTG